MAAAVGRLPAGNNRQPGKIKEGMGSRQSPLRLTEKPGHPRGACRGQGPAPQRQGQQKAGSGGVCRRDRYPTSADAAHAKLTRQGLRPAGSSTP